MARCLEPRTIPNPAVWEKRQLAFPQGQAGFVPLWSVTISGPFFRYHHGSVVSVLLSQEQAEFMVVRCRREAEQRGSFAFMTLTYDDDHLPIVESMWKVNVKTDSEQVVRLTLCPPVSIRNLHILIFPRR